jgi:hypothetical protein
MGATGVNTHGTRSAPALRFASNNCGFYTNPANGYLNFAATGTSPLVFAPQGLMFSAGAFLQWTSGVNDPLDSSTIELALLRDGAANTLALRNGAAAQTFRVYYTYTDANNYERVRMNWVSDTFAIFAEAAGTGTQRNINIGGTTTALWSGSALTRRWNVNSSGHFTSEVDNSYDIGASGANRPRNVYVGSQLAVGTNASFGSFIYAAKYYWDVSKGLLDAPSDGVFTFSNRAATDFGRLQFGGTTASFPALKRSTTSLQAVLANDSGFTNIQGKLTTDTAYTGTTVVPTGFITLYDSTGTAYKVPCVAA